MEINNITPETIDGYLFECNLNYEYECDDSDYESEVFSVDTFVNNTPLYEYVVDNIHSCVNNGKYDEDKLIEEFFYAEISLLKKLLNESKSIQKVKILIYILNEIFINDSIYDCEYDEEVENDVCINEDYVEGLRDIFDEEFSPYIKESFV